MQDDQFDLIVIGAGSGGVASANAAAGLGAKVAIIEQGKLGGTCVNLGCVPKKIMWNAAHIAEVIKDAKFYGYTVSQESFELDYPPTNIQLQVLCLAGPNFQHPAIH